MCTRVVSVGPYTLLLWLIIYPIIILVSVRYILYYSNSYRFFQVSIGLDFKVHLKLKRLFNERASGNSLPVAEAAVKNLLSFGVERPTLLTTLTPKMSENHKHQLANSASFSSFILT